MASDHTLSREHATTPHEDPPTASSRRPPRREGDGTRSRGLISPSRRTFSAAPAGVLSVWCPRVSPKSTSAHQCPACACGQKTTLRAPRWRPSRGTAPRKKTCPAAQRTGGHRRVATRKVTDDRATRRGAVDPVRRSEWTMVLRYGHLRSAPVVVSGFFTHGVGTACTQCSLHGLHAPRLGARWLTASLTTQTRLLGRTERMVACFLMTDRERLRDAFTLLSDKSRTSRKMQKGFFARIAYY